MKNFIIAFLLIMLTAIGVFFVKDLKSVPSITYFPINYGTSFDSAETNLDFSYTDQNKYYQVAWNVRSKTEIPMYLRQDVSLLFASGELYGMRSLWRESTDTIAFSEHARNHESNKWQAITFHYGELHQYNLIKSIQQISYDELYTIKENNHYNGFHISQMDGNEDYKKSIDRKGKNKLLEHWQDSVHYFHINLDDYYSIPLTSLYLYQKNHFRT